MILGCVCEGLCGVGSLGWFPCLSWVFGFLFCCLFLISMWLDVEFTDFVVFWFCI